MQGYRCFVLGCGFVSPSTKSYNGHVSRAHLPFRCKSCDVTFHNVDDLEAHFLDEDGRPGCKKRTEKKQRTVPEGAPSRSDGDDVVEGGLGSAEPEREEEEDFFFFAVSDDADVELLPDLELQLEAVVEEGLIMLPSGDLDEGFLAAAFPPDDAGLVHVGVKSLISFNALEEAFWSWFRAFQARQQALQENSLAEQLQQLCISEQLPRNCRRKLFDLFAQSVSPSASPYCSSFAEFEAFRTEGLVVETVICSNPRLVFSHIPLLIGAVDVLRDKDTVFHIPLRGDGGIRLWTQGGKFHQLMEEFGNGTPVVVWGLFIDKTRVVRKGQRKCHVIMARPLNNPRGLYDIVGFVPIVKDKEAGGKAKGPSFRAHVEQICLSVVLMFAGAWRNGPKFWARNCQNDIVMARSVVGMVSADGEEVSFWNIRVVSFLHLTDLRVDWPCDSLCPDFGSASCLLAPQH